MTRDFRQHDQTQADAQAARGLGWASIGIGLLEISAPKQVQAMLGLEDTPERRGVLRVLGIREILHGVSILTEATATPRLATGVWSRVAGDVLDTALLAAAGAQTKKPLSFGTVAAMVMGIGVADTVCAARVTRKAMSGGGNGSTRSGRPRTDRALVA